MMKTRILRHAVLTGGAALLAMGPLQASAETLRLGYQPWPGVTVKTEVAAQVVRALGYDVEVSELDPQFVYQGMASDDIDATLGTWMPAHEDMSKDVREGGATELGVNIDDAVQGLAVPGYVHDEYGIETVEDLVEHADVFDATIYGIESGAGMTRNLQNAVEDDYKGLGDWEVQSSSTAGMLSQVERAAGDEEPIVFHGWRPHWMDLEFDLQYIVDEDSTLEEGDEIAGQESTVYTLAMEEWADANPQTARFLGQIEVPLDEQSVWIDELTREERDADAIARDWIADNLDRVGEWLDGVEAADGSDGIEAVRAEYGD